MYLVSDLFSYFSHLCLGLASSLFPSDFFTTRLHAVLYPPARTCCGLSQITQAFYICIELNILFLYEATILKDSRKEQEIVSDYQICAECLTAFYPARTVVTWSEARVLESATLPCRLGLLSDIAPY